jgi:hypothetical protein
MGNILPNSRQGSHEELDTHHKVLGTHKQSTPRAGEGATYGVRGGMSPSRSTTTPTYGRRSTLRRGGQLRLRPCLLAACG